MKKQHFFCPKIYDQVYTFLSKAQKKNYPAVEGERMSIVQELENFNTTPAYAATLKQFPRAAVAQKMGIGSTYLCNILSGSKSPSEKLHNKLTDLARQIEAEGGRS